MKAINPREKRHSEYAQETNHGDHESKGGYEAGAHHGEHEHESDHAKAMRRTLRWASVVVRNTTWKPPRPTACASKWFELMSELRGAWHCSSRQR